jgi:acetyl-CoA acetyltransferase
MTEAFILGGVRTPVGRYGGSLSHVRAALDEHVRMCVTPADYSAGEGVAA